MMLRSCLMAVMALLILVSATPAQTGGAHWEDPACKAQRLSGLSSLSFPITVKPGEAQPYFDQGMDLLHGAWHQEAERSFLQVAKLDPDCAMAWWGRALANAGDPSRATWFAWQAFRNRRHASAREQAYIVALARYYGAESEPKTVLVDAESGRRRAIARTLTTADDEALERAFAAIAETHPEDVHARALLLRHRLLSGRGTPATWPDSRRHLDAIFEVAEHHPARRYEVLLSAHLPPDQRPNGMTCRRAARGMASMWHADGLVLAARGDHAAACDAFEAASRVDHAHMKRSHALPWEMPLYVENMVARCRCLLDAGRPRDAEAIARQLIALPRHPRRVDGSLFFGETLLAEALERARTSPGPADPRDVPRAIADLGPAVWTPLPAPRFDLDRGQGGRVALKNYIDKNQPVIVVFYLGAGCLHCVEQLRELAPKVGLFRRARMPILAVGTDDLQNAKAFIQLSMESGEGSHLPFPILCDPLRTAFSDYKAYSHYADEPLHGTFVIDGKGRLRWRDISIEPFMDTEFLLEECTRLLKQ